MLLDLEYLFAIDNFQQFLSPSFNPLDKISKKNNTKIPTKKPNTSGQFKHKIYGAPVLFNPGKNAAPFKLSIAYPDRTGFVLFASG